MTKARVLTATATSALSVLGAHHIAYRVAVADAEAREHLLEHSGHGWWAYAPVLAGVALAAVCMGVARTTSVRTHRLLALSAPVAYVTVETLERVVGGGHHGVVHLPTLTVGAVVASLLGLLASRLLKVVEEYVLALRTTRRYQRVTTVHSPPQVLLRPVQLVSANGERAPPAR
jgi:hypothetical protein